MRQPIKQTKKFGGKKFTLVDVFDGPGDAEKTAAKLKKRGVRVRVELRRYSPPYGAEFNMWYVWARK